MQHILICLLFYVAVALSDGIPLIRKKAWNYLYFYLPAFFGSLILNLMIGLGVRFPSITQMLENILPHM